MSTLFIQFILVLCVLAQVRAEVIREDLVTHEGCVGAKLGDRVLFHYSFHFQNDTLGPELRKYIKSYIQCMHDDVTKCIYH